MIVYHRIIISISRVSSCRQTPLGSWISFLGMVWPPVSATGSLTVRNGLLQSYTKIGVQLVFCKLCRRRDAWVCLTLTMHKPTLSWRTTIAIRCWHYRASWIRAGQEKAMRWWCLHRILQVASSSQNLKFCRQTSCNTPMHPALLWSSSLTPPVPRKSKRWEKEKSFF